MKHGDISQWASPPLPKSKKSVYGEGCMGTGVDMI